MCLTLETLYTLLIKLMIYSITNNAVHIRFRCAVNSTSYQIFVFVFVLVFKKFTLKKIVTPVGFSINLSHVQELFRK